MKKKWIVAGLFGALASMMIASAAFSATVNQGAVLGGKVVEVVPVGTVVKEGDPLLKVETIGGPMVAARAIVGGKITSVTVEVGATVEVGQNIAVIDGK